MQAGTIIADRWRIERLAGTGGMSSVFLARDVVTDAPVAIKVLLGDMRRELDRFEREARLLFEVVHPAIVRYVDHGRLTEGTPYLVLEWLEGEDLEKRLARSGLTVAESVTLVGRIAEALGAVHALGIVHRDIKPSNVFLVGGRIEAAKLLDFGVARTTTFGGNVTRTGTTIGTPAYMAPEQARGDRELDARVDVFALGGLLFECLTGRAAFPGDNAMAVLAKILVEQAPDVAELRQDVPAPVSDLVARMLSKDPDARPRNGAAVAAAIAALGTVGSTAPAPASLRHAALTSAEQRMLCVVMGRPRRVDAVRVGTAPTEAAGELATSLARIQHVVEVHGGNVLPLVGGSVLVTMTARSGATDQAARAARCALALRELAPELGLALAMGRATVTDSWPAGEVIDRAARLLADGGARAVRVDEVSAGLLDTRFALGGDDRGLLLLGERDVEAPVRTLMGRPTPFVGRDRELRALGDLAAECFEEPVARLALVTGPAGSGKSRVAWELRRRLVEGGTADVWVGRGDPMSAGSAFGLLARTVRRVAGLSQGETAEVSRAKLRARVARNVPEADVSRLAEFLGEISGVPFPDEGRVELVAARRDPVLLGDQIVRAFEDLLAAECAAKPLVLVLEDVHWGDAGSVKVVTSALKNLRELPLFVLLLARPEVHEMFPRLAEVPSMQEVRLGELSRKAAERLVREVLPDADAAVVERIVTQAAGNALYLEELIRAVATGAAEELPETVIAMMQARLEALESDARRVLRAASVFGQAFARAGVHALLGGADRTTLLTDWLRELVKREVLVHRGSSDRDEYAFRHALVRDAAYAMLTQEDLRLGHRLAGAWLEASGVTDALILAEHFERGGEPARAVGWYRQAADQALAQGDVRRAHELAASGLSCGAEGEMRACLLDVQMDALEFMGAPADQLELGRIASSLVPEGSPKWAEIVVKTTVAAAHAGVREHLDDVTERLLLVQLDGVEAGPAIRVAAERLVAALLRRGRYELADRLLERLVRAQQALVEPDPLLDGAILTGQSWAALYAGDLARSLHCEEAAADAYERGGNRRLACKHRVGAGYSYLVLGALPDAIRLLREAGAQAERLGIDNIVMNAMHNLSLALARTGDIAEGRRLQELALQAYIRRGDARMIGLARSYQSLVLLLGGDLAEAEREGVLAVEALVMEPPLRTMALGILARARLALGDVTRAVADAEAAHGELTRLGVIEDGEELVRVTWAQALMAAGRADEARAAIRVARDRLVARAERITDAKLRASFFTGVPENALTLDLAGDWLGAE